MPLTHRIIQADGLTIFHIRYWHPIFAAWRVDRKRVLVRYRSWRPPRAARIPKSMER
ncbi:Mu transposase C-terminal domain-containing protein [Variovorax sp. YR216]|uniref:Mu transposase C-terminal domain-containing protein n=1 Tax=Variovorax sp. YR216 TaxID=1882828 RepID=UPI0015A42BBC